MPSRGGVLDLPFEWPRELPYGDSRRTVDDDMDACEGLPVGRCDEGDPAGVVAQGML